MRRRPNPNTSNSRTQRPPPRRRLQVRAAPPPAERAEVHSSTQIPGTAHAVPGTLFPKKFTQVQTMGAGYPVHLTGIERLRGWRLELEIDGGNHADLSRAT